MTKIAPLHDRVAIRPEKAAEVSKGGIIIPDVAQEKPQQGEVVAIGTGRKDDPMILAIGDVVLYPKYGGTEISLNGEDVLIIRQSDIIAIIK